MITKSFLAFVLGALSLASMSNASDKDRALGALGKLPVLEGGRLKPWDSVARNDLLLIHERQEWRGDHGKWKAIEWLAEVLFNPVEADTRPVFRVMHPDVRQLLGNESEDQKFYSFQEILPSLPRLADQAGRARQVERQLRDSYQRAVLSLFDHLTLYQELKRSLSPHDQARLSEELETYSLWMNDPLKSFQQQQAGEAFDSTHFQLFIQTAARYRALAGVARARTVAHENEWDTLWDAMVRSAPTGQPPVEAVFYAQMQDHYLKGEWKAFRESAEKLALHYRQVDPRSAFKGRLEAGFNKAEIFYRSSIVYLLAFLLVLVSWVRWEKPLNRAAFWLLALAFTAHSVGMIIRMIIQERPPVTNLYASALLVGWGSVLLGLLLERMYRNGIGSATAAAVGFLSLIVAHNLAGDGDTMAMLQAVLDTNFWLATHVVIITLGYSATFLAGFLGALYIVRGFFSKSLDEKTAASLERMVFGIVCFSLLFSFVGTVLGGIWADQSWGRFWGWDPKENGALLIVLWNALILHARWGRMLGRQGLMVTVIFGNIVTAWSWFGTNMLGIGLHSYGFMEEAFFWLAAFGVSQLLLMGIGCIPPRWWESFSRPTLVDSKGDGAGNAGS